VCSKGEICVLRVTTLCSKVSCVLRVCLCVLRVCCVF
jgi:hypothetical protein